MDNHISSIAAGLDMVLEELNHLNEAIRQKGASAFASGELDQVEEAQHQLKVVEDFTNRFSQLSDRWEELLQAELTPPRPRRKQQPVGRTFTGRVPRGQLLPRKAYCVPLLRILDQHGGSGPMSQILDELEKTLGHKFMPPDKQLLPSGNDIRWRNRAQWTRYELAQIGLLRDDSPRGIWGLTDAGRRALREGDADGIWRRVLQYRRGL